MTRMGDRFDRREGRSRRERRPRHIGFLGGRCLGNSRAYGGPYFLLFRTRVGRVRRRHLVRHGLRPAVRRHGRADASFARQTDRAAGRHAGLLRPRVHTVEHRFRACVRRIADRMLRRAARPWSLPYWTKKSSIVPAVRDRNARIPETPARVVTASTKVQACPNRSAIDPASRPRASASHLANLLSVRRFPADARSILRSV